MIAMPPRFAQNLFNPGWCYLFKNLSKLLIIDNLICKVLRHNDKHPKTSSNLDLRHKDFPNHPVGRQFNWAVVFERDHVPKPMLAVRVLFEPNPVALRGKIDSFGMDRCWRVVNVHCRLLVGSRTGRVQPRVTVSRQPPGIRRRDLIGTNPNERMVGAIRRPLPVVFGRPSKSRRLWVLMASMPRTTASTFSRKGSALRLAASAFASLNCSIRVNTELSPSPHGRPYPPQPFP